MTALLTKSTADTKNEIFDGAPSGASVANYLCSIPSKLGQAQPSAIELREMMFMAQFNFLATTGQAFFDSGMRYRRGRRGIFFEGAPMWLEHAEDEASSAEWLFTVRGTNQGDLPLSDRAYLDRVWFAHRDRSKGLRESIDASWSPWNGRYSGPEQTIRLGSEKVTAHLMSRLSSGQLIFPAGITVISDELLSRLG